MPKFSTASNPELDAMFHSIRENVLIPSYLFKQHRNFVYRPKNHKLLQDPEHPVVVNVGGEEVQLAPRAPWHPPVLRTFTDALNLMKTDSDLNNIPALISAFAVADLPLREKQFEKVARMLSLSGRTDILLKLARTAKDHPNHIKFTKETAREFMRGFLLQNQIPNIKDEAVKSLRGISQFLDILGNPENKRDAAERLRSDTVIVGMELYASASASQRYNAGKDYKSITKKAAKRFLEGWDEGKEEIQGTLKNNAAGRNRVKLLLLDFQPVLEGLGVAKEILADQPEAEKLRGKERKLKDIVIGWKGFLSRQEMPVTRTWDAYKNAAVELGQKRAPKAQVANEEAPVEEEESKAEKEGETKVEA